MNKEAMLDDVYTEAMMQELEKLGFKLSTIPKAIMSRMRKRPMQTRPIVKNVQSYQNNAPRQKAEDMIPMLQKVRDATKKRVSIYDMI